MNRIAYMVLRNFFRAPIWFYHIWKLGRSGDTHTEQQRYDYIRNVVKTVNRTGRVEVEVHGIQNLPEKNGFILFPNHQGLFDVLAIMESCPNPLGIVVKKEASNIILIDHHASFGHIRDSLFKIEEAAKETGVRSCLCYEISDRDGMDKAREAVMENAAFIKHALADDSDMIDRRNDTGRQGGDSAAGNRGRALCGESRGVVLQGSGCGSHRGSQVHGGLHHADCMEGAPSGSEAFPACGSRAVGDHHPVLFGHVRLCRRRRSGRYCHQIRLLPLSDRDDVRNRGDSRYHCPDHTGGGHEAVPRQR